MVYTDHKNLTYKNLNTEHDLRWQLLIKEFGPTIKYIKGPKNIIANVLSRLNLVSLPSNVQDMVDCYHGLDKDDLPSDAFLIAHQLINHEQQKDETLLTNIKQPCLKNVLPLVQNDNYSEPKLVCRQLLYNVYENIQSVYTFFQFLSQQISK